MLGQKMKKAALVFFVIFFAAVSLCSAQEKIIRLKDGTIMRGRLVSKGSDVYVIETTSLGKVNVAVSDVISIEDMDVLSASTSEMEAMQKKVLSNPEIITTVQGLMQDKDVLEMLADPDLKNAILRKDAEYLKNNEKFLKFTQSPAVKKIVEEMGYGRKN